MIVEVEPRSPAHDVARLAAALAVHEDVSAWPVCLRDRAFVVVSGDEDLVPEIGSPIVLGRHSTRERGYWLVDRTNGLAPNKVPVAASTVGGDTLWCAAGPCALEDVDDALETALRVRDQGAAALRMGLFKPRSSPYHFLGKGRAGLGPLAEIRAASGLPVVTEVLDPRDVEAVAAVADCLQVDTRNMVNRALLAELGQAGRPVLLMRGLRSTVAEWLRAAEFVFSHGNPDVVLCARGIVSFDDSLAFQPDFGVIAEVRKRTALPVIFDPSHSTGRLAAVAPAALAAAAFGADGLLIEAHVHPGRTYRPGDGPQMYPPGQLGHLLRGCAEVRRLAATLAPAVTP
jgi:3-deoxy-7-phosphoheptulonate synthase